MSSLTRREILALLLAAPAATRSFAADAPWFSLFDGKSLDGWKASEHEGTFSVADGQIQVHGSRSHLYYTGPLHHADFKNFEFSADVMTRPGANSGIYFHTAFQQDGFPSQVSKSRSPTPSRSTTRRPARSTPCATCTSRSSTTTNGSR